MATTGEETNQDPIQDAFESSSSPLEDTTLRRNNRGIRFDEFYLWPPQPLEEMDSPLAVQQYIQQLILKDPSNIDEILKLPEGQDLGAWKIEHLRLFCMQLNRLAAKLQDCCHPETCKQMTATEQWIFLCAAHKQPSECPAIDYTMHTLDGAASLLNNGKYFPSRVTIKESSVAKLGSVCRRVYRIFSHAYYHHFQVFDEYERETHLCKRFSKFVTTYDLMSKESLIVPAEPPKPGAVASGDPMDATIGGDTTTVSDLQESSSPAESTTSASSTTTATFMSTTSSQIDLNNPENTTTISSSSSPSTTTDTTKEPAQVAPQTESNETDEPKLAAES